MNGSFKPNRYLALLLTAFGLLFSSVPLMAQSATDDNDEMMLEEVVVTARLREESILEIPVSVTAFDGVNLERQGIYVSTQLFGRVPSLYFSQNNSRQSTADNTALVIRGVGANPVLEPSVGVFVDGIYVPSLGFDLNFLDVERVEVLRGPQGSLFGRNTEGGAIRIITRKPSDEFRARAMIEWDDLDSIRAMASMSGPLIGDDFSASLMFGYNDSDGWTRNTYLDQSGNDRRSSLFRLTLRYTPSEATEVIFTADGKSEKGSEQGTAIDLADGDVYTFANDFDGDMEEDDLGFSLNINHNFSNMRFTSLTGYREIDSSRASDVDNRAEGPSQTGNEQRTFADQETWSQEFRLESDSDGSFDWIAGVYAYGDDETYETDIRWDTYFALGPDSPPGNAITHSRQKRSGYSVFGQGYFSLADDLVDLTVGLRYSDDKVKGERFNFINIASFGFQRTNPDPNDPNATGKAETDYTNFSGTFQAMFNVSDGFRPYLGIAQGYKGGGFDRYPTSSSLYLPVEEETTINYELGAKGAAAGGRLTYAIAAFRVDISDLQMPTLVINPDTGLLATAIENAGEAHTQGLEFESYFAVNDYLRLNGNISFMKAEFDDFIDADGNQRKGDDIPNVPEMTGRFGALIDVPFGDSKEFTGSLDLRYVGEYLSGLGTSQDFQFSYDDYVLLDLTAGVRFGGRYELIAFVRNALDEYVVLNKSRAFVGGLSSETFVAARVAAPRVFGVRFTAEF